MNGPHESGCRRGGGLRRRVRCRQASGEVTSQDQPTGSLGQPVGNWPLPALTLRHRAGMARSYLGPSGPQESAAAPRSQRLHGWPSAT